MITFISVIKFFFSLGNRNRRIKVSICFSQIESLNKGFFSWSIVDPSLKDTPG